MKEEQYADVDNTYDHVLKYTSLFGGAQGLSILTSIIRNKLAAVLLGPSGIGLISLFNNITTLISQATNMGIPFSGVRQMAELSESNDKIGIQVYAKTVRTWSVVVGLLGMLICLTLSWHISLWTFKNHEHIFDICLLAPIVAMMAVNGGELAILKGLKQLKGVILSSVLGGVATLFLSIPVYLLFGLRGIALALLICQAAVLAITLYISNRALPWRINLRSAETFKSGKPMLILGIGYIIAGIFGQGAELIIRTQIFQYGGDASVGLYQCGYALMVSYASIVFVAFEADFYPRLSAISNDRENANRVINQQIEVGILLITPILALFILVMPLLVHILYSKGFMAAVPMAICAIPYMFFKALTLPVSYLPLAKGDSGIYMIAELIYDIFIALTIPFVYHHFGLIGAGCAISLAGLFDFLMIHGFYRIKYGYRLNLRPLHLYIFLFIFLAAAIAVSFCDNLPLKWGVGIAVFLITSFFSIRTLSRNTNIIDTIRKKIIKRKK